MLEYGGQYGKRNSRLFEDRGSHMQDIVPLLIWCKEWLLEEEISLVDLIG